MGDAQMTTAQPSLSFCRYECRHRSDDSLVVVIELEGDSHPDWQLLAEGAHALERAHGIGTSMEQVRYRRARIGHNATRGEG
jgi:hypothetical protein